MVNAIQRHPSRVLDGVEVESLVCTILDHEIKILRYSTDKNKVRVFIDTPRGETYTDIMDLDQVNRYVQSLIRPDGAFVALDLLPMLA